MGETKSIGRLIEAVLGSRAFHDFVTVVRDAAEWAEDGHPVMMSKVFHRRDTLDRIFAYKRCLPERSPRWALLHELFVAFLALDNFKRLREAPSAVLFLFCHLNSSFQSSYGFVKVHL